MIVAETIAALDSRGWIVTEVFVVMPDHLHWLFELGTEQGLAEVVRHAKGRSAACINREMGRRGPVWQRGYFETQIRSESRYAAIGEYILNNPVRAGLVERWQDYPLLDHRWTRYSNLVDAACSGGCRG